MKAIFCITLMALLSSCSYLPEISSDVEKVLTDDAVIIKVDKDAFQKDTDVNINVDIRNKDVPQKVF